MGSKHKLLAVTTQLRVAVVCLQECINTLAELHDSFDQNDASLVLRESSFSSLTSHRDRNNKTKEEERSSLGELTPRTCNSKSEDELEQNQLKQEEAEEEEEEATQLASQQKGQQEQSNRNSLGEHKQQQPHKSKREQQLPKKKRWCQICWKTGHTTEACWYNDQQQTWQQQSAATSAKESELRPYNYNLTLGDQPMGSLQRPAQATQQLAYQQTQQNTRNSLGEHKNNKNSWAILVDTGAAISVAPRKALLQRFNSQL